MTTLRAILKRESSKQDGVLFLLNNSGTERHLTATTITQDLRPEEMMIRWYHLEICKHPSHLEHHECRLATTHSKQDIIILRMAEFKK